MKVNLHRGYAYSNAEWNNWNVATNLSAPGLRYTDGSITRFSAMLSSGATVYENGTTYGSGMAPAEVLRFSSYATNARTLTLTGLSTLRTYNLELYASRNEINKSSTIYTINKSSWIIVSDKNLTNKAVFTAITPTADGKIVVTIKSPHTNNYINGFMLTENSTTVSLKSGITIKADRYANMLGVQQIPTSDIGGGQNVSYIDKDDWMDYSVQVPAAGIYTLKLRLASGIAGGQFIIKNTSGTSLATVYVPNTGGYQAWEDVRIAIQLPAGAQTLRFLSAADVRWNFNHFELSGVSSSEPVTLINKISTKADLGTKIEAENYTAMYGVSKYITSDFAGGGQNTTSIDKYDWMNYHVTTVAAGLHTLNFRVAAHVTGAQFFVKDSTGKVLATVAVPNTGGWQTWRDATAEVMLPVGTQTLVIESATALRWNFNYFEVVRTGLNSFASYTLRPSSGSSIYLPNGLNLAHLKPGDTLNILAGTYNTINIGNFRGSAAYPIIIRNKGGQVICKILNFTNTSEYFSALGNGQPGVTYGFKVNGNNTTGNGVFAYGKGIEIAYTEVMNSSAGFFIKRNPDVEDPISVHPNYLMSNVRLHHNYIHDISGEAMYIGHTKPDGGSNPDLLPVRMQNVEIAYNILDRIGWDGIQLSNATTGNKIHHNTITNFGTANQYSQQAGIILGGNTSGDVYDNTIKNGSGNAIQNFGFGLNKIYNNYIENVGNNGTTKGLESIFCNDIVLSSEVRPKQQMEVYNNTIKYPHTWGAVRVSGYNENSLPAKMQYNKLLIPNAPDHWQKLYFHTYVPNSIISNNSLIY